MNLFRKLQTAMRGTAYNTVQVVTDQQILTIAEQELRESKQSLLRAKNDVAQLIATRMQLQRELDHLNGVIEKRSELVRKKLEASQEDEAKAVAERIVTDEQQSQRLQEQIRNLQQKEKKLRDGLDNTRHTITRYQQELATARATARAQTATSRLLKTDVLPTNQLQEARQTLDRIAMLQDQNNDRVSAAESLEIELIDEDLDEVADFEKEEAVNTVLERLRKKPE